MKKFGAILLVLLLILSMAVPVFAVTPPLDTPASPTVPDIEVDLDLPSSAFKDYIPNIDFDVEITEPTEAPTEPPSEEQPDHPWCDWLNKWLRWWRDKIC